MILLRPNHDGYTKTTHEWASRLIGQVPILEDLEKDRATAEQLQSALQTHASCDLIAYYGHGSASSLWGHVSSAGTPAMPHAIRVVGKSIEPKELASRKVYAVACYAGMNLGPALRKIKCSFVGYRDLFWIPPIIEETADIVNIPLLDWSRGASKRLVAKNLKASWKGLAKSCRSNGTKNHLPDMIRSTIGAYALINADAVVYF